MNLEKALTELNLLEEADEPVFKEPKLKEVHEIINKAIFDYFSNLKADLNVADLNVMASDWKVLSDDITRALNKKNLYIKELGE